MKYNYHDGFIRLVALFILLGLAYVIGGAVVQRETAQNEASAIESLRMQEYALYQ